MDTRVHHRRALTAALVVTTSIAVSFLAGCSAAPSAAPTQGSASAPAPVASASPSPSGAFGGSVQYQIDGAPATTEVDAVASGESVSGTAVTTFRAGTHTVRLACAAAQDGGSWVLGGTTEKSTIPGEPVGAWSAVIIKDGSPQQIGIWLSADPAAGSDCEAFVASIKPAELDPGAFSPVESGALVPPA